MPLLIFLYIFFGRNQQLPIHERNTLHAPTWSQFSVQAMYVTLRELKTAPVCWNKEKDPILLY
jgi:hypothetical protein